MIVKRNQLNLLPKSFMTLDTRLKDYFKASLTIAALDNPSPEELSAVESIAAIADNLNVECYTFDVVSLFRAVTIDPEAGVSFEIPKFNFEAMSDPIADAIEFIRAYEGKAIFILCDVHKYIDPNDQSRFDNTLVRRIKTLAFELKQSHKRVVMLGQGITLPDDLHGIVQELSNPLPSAIEIQAAIAQTLSDLESYPDWTQDLDESGLKRLVRASQGLTLTEIGDLLRLAVVRDRRIDLNTADILNQAKMYKLRKLKVEFSEPPTVSVGGLDLLKKWLVSRTKRFQQYENNARPAPKGMMLVGIAGTGKSMIAKAIGHQWGIPILSVDFGAIYSSLVGDSEANLRRLLEVSEAIAPCVLLIDEVDKAMAGMQSSNDSGVSQRLLGKLLTWMQEKKAPVFVCCTANNISGLPAEFTRKGRFDEIFFVDLPNKDARKEIILAHAQKYSGIEFNCTPENLESLAILTKDFSGAEIAAAVDEAISVADDNDANEIGYGDLENAIRETKPLAYRNLELVTALRTWASVSARPAASVDVIAPNTAPASGSRKAQMMV
jgi:SpoVK/Ycf46/Vps4 family AAA+-type ATPase